MWECFTCTDKCVFNFSNEKYQMYFWPGLFISKQTMVYPICFQTNSDLATNCCPSFSLYIIKFTSVFNGKYLVNVQCKMSSNTLIGDYNLLIIMILYIDVVDMHNWGSLNLCFVAFFSLIQVWCLLFLSHVWRLFLNAFVPVNLWFQDNHYLFEDKIILINMYYRKVKWLRCFQL